MAKTGMKRILRAKKRNMILNKSLELFTSKGFTRTKISDITYGLEIGKGTFYLYYKNKEDLFRACMRRVAIVVQPKHLQTNITDGQHFEQTLYERTHSLCKAFPELSGIFMILRRALKLEDPKYYRMARNYICNLMQPFVRDLEKANASGILRDVDFHSVSHFILALGETVGYRLMFDKGFAFEETLKTYMDIIRYGIMKPRADTLLQN
jgi:AcrR family transcriptional regulator